MKKVKYNFNGEIQLQPVYTKKEMINKLGFFDDPDYTDNPFRDMAISAMRHQKGANAAIFTTLKENCKTLLNILPNRNYLHIEFINIIDKLHEPDDVINYLNTSSKLWDHVIDDNL